MKEQKASVQNHNLNIEIIVTDSSVTFDRSCAFRTEEHLHRLSVRSSVFICLQAIP